MFLCTVQEHVKIHIKGIWKKYQDTTEACVAHRRVNTTKAWPVCCTRTCLHSTPPEAGAAPWHVFTAEACPSTGGVYTKRALAVSGLVYATEASAAHVRVYTKKGSELHLDLFLYYRGPSCLWTCLLWLVLVLGSTLKFWCMLSVCKILAYACWVCAKKRPKHAECSLKKAYACWVCAKNLLAHAQRVLHNTNF